MELLNHFDRIGKSRNSPAKGAYHPSTSSVNPELVSHTREPFIKCLIMLLQCLSKGVISHKISSAKANGKDYTDQSRTIYRSFTKTQFFHNFRFILNSVSPPQVVYYSIERVWGYIRVTQATIRNGTRLLPAAFDDCHSGNPAKRHHHRREPGRQHYAGAVDGNCP